jgi:hypothetical protein
MSNMMVVASIVVVQAGRGLIEEDEPDS